MRVASSVLSRPIWPEPISDLISVGSSVTDGSHNEGSIGRAAALVSRFKLLIAMVLVLAWNE